MSNSKYAAFAAAVETGSLTRAAEKLGYTQSGVSHLIRSLEDELGLSLLLRTKGGVTLTPEGRDLLPHIRDLLAAERDIQRISENLRGLSAGTVCVGTFSSAAIAWMPELTRRFALRYPGVRIDILNGTYSVVEEALLSDRVDCAFVTTPSRAEFSVTPLLRDRLMALLPSDSPLAAAEKVTAKQLSALPYIVPAEGTEYDAGKFFARAGHSPQVRFNAGDDYAALALARKGLGFTVLPELLLRDLTLNGLCAVPLSGAGREIALAVSRTRCLSPALNAFVHFVQEVLPELNG